MAYTVYTMKQLFSAFSMISLAGVSMTTQASQIWADGVSETSGYIDYEKQKTTGDGDDNLCWAASASNILDFWQQRYVVPTGTPTGKDIWAQFKNACQYDVGGSFLTAVQWWIGGDYQGTTWTETAEGAENNRAAYWAAASELIAPDGSSQSVYPIYTDIATFSGYYWDVIPETWVRDADINTNERHSHLSENFLWGCSYKEVSLAEVLLEQFSEGMPISLNLSSDGKTTLGHTVTLWGMEYEEDAHGQITLKNLWITDSDDYKTNLREISVTQEDETIYLTNYSTYEPYGNVFLMEAYGINISESNTWFLSTIPEPTTATLSLLALATLAARRRRK